MEVAPLPEQVIDGAELLLGVKFPADYRICLAQNHGAHPDACDFRAGEPNNPWYGGIGVLLTVDPYMPENMFDVLASLAVDQQLPKGVVPIAEDGGGNMLCLDYREDSSRSTPKVAFWFHEVGGDDGIVPVCDTFTELLSLLYVPDDVIEDRKKQAGDG